MFLPLRVATCEVRRQSLFKIQKKAFRSYIVLPEIPSCTVDNNAALKNIESGGFPALASTSVNDNIDATAKLAMEFEKFATYHAVSFNDAKSARTFQTVIEPLNKQEAVLDYAWGVLRQKLIANCPPKARVDARVKKNGIAKLISRCRSVQFTEPSLYRAVKEVAADVNSLNDFQSRLCQKFLLECKLEGADIQNPKDRMIIGEYRKKIFVEQETFWYNVEQSNQSIDNYAKADDLTGTPPHLLCQWSLTRDYFSGPYKASLTPSGYLSFLTWCKNRMRRSLLWRYWNSRAAFFEGTAVVNNALKVTEIQEYRNDVAKMLGFKTFSEQAMVNKMAHSLDEIEKFIILLQEKCTAKFQKKRKEMESYAKCFDTVDAVDTLRPWDYNYFARKIAENETNFNEVSFSKAFPFEETWNNLLALTEQLFGIKFVDVTNVKNIERIHESVKVYCLNDAKTGKEIGYLYFDPYVRPEKYVSTWVDCARTRNLSLNFLPIVFLYADVCADKDGEFCLSLDQLISVTKCFGKALVSLLSEPPYMLINGLRSVENDAVDVYGEVMKWIVLEPSVLHTLSGQRLSLEGAQATRKYYVESALPHLLRETLLSEYDLTLHNSMAYWFDVWKDMYKRYYLQPADRFDIFPCSFKAVMLNDNVAASYYSSLWSEMLACDIVAAFRECNFENKENISVLGRKFRELYLNSGGGCHSRELFKKFRGRDFEFNHIFNFYNLQ